MKLSDMFHSPRSGARYSRRSRALHSAAPPPPFICRAAALFIALSAAASSEAADAGYTLGVPAAPTLRLSANAAANAWLSANPNYPAMAIVAAATNAAAISAQVVAGADRVSLAAAEAGFPLERTKPEYYLGDAIDPPPGVDWPATYARFLADNPAGFLFDPTGQRVYATLGGSVRFTWILADGSETEMTYIVSSSCSGRPRRIYWTDYPYNGPAIDLSGKFVKFFGPDELVKPVYGVYTNEVGGMSQVLTNRVVSGLYYDSSTKMLYAYGQLQGQVVMAYYDTGTYDRLLHVQTVEICRPVVNVMKGEIGRALRPDGRGYPTAGLRARPTLVSPTDGRGDYLYQHKGKQSYSPKNGWVYPLRPTVDCRWNAEVYWMETDEMVVQWPFELDQYECDWPADATVFVRGDVDGDTGRPIFVPEAFTPTLMGYQDPEGHARAVDGDGTFKTTGEGFSLLKLATDDNVWFVPVHSILRSNTDYFTLAPEGIAVGTELKLRGGSVAGTAPGFSPSCDPDSPGYIYPAASGTHYNPRLYSAPQSSASAQANQASAVSTATDTNTYASVIYAVAAESEDGKPLEVWWNTSILEEGMPAALEIPTLPQVYRAHWPEEWEAPQIVIASQQGSAADSLFSQNMGLYLDGAESTAPLASRAYFAAEGGTLLFWFRPEGLSTNSAPASVLSLSSADGATTLAVDLRAEADEVDLVVSLNGAQQLSLPIPEDELAEIGGWVPVALTITPGSLSALAYFSGEDECAGDFSPLLGARVNAALGASGDLPARPGVSIAEVLFWSSTFAPAAVLLETLYPHTGKETGLTGCYSFREGTDLSVVAGSDRRLFTDKAFGTRHTARHCLAEAAGPPLFGSGVIAADAGTTPVVYVQNDPDALGYNPNEEHAIVTAGSGGHVAWALRADLNTEESSAPGVLVEYVTGGRKSMRWFGVAVTNDWYPELAADCTAGLALPGPHPLDMFDNPWMDETYWEEPVTNAPAFRDRKNQLWARAAGDLHVHMYYPMQEGFAFPQLDEDKWPEVGEAVPWLSLLDRKPTDDPLAFDPAAWLWRCAWPENPVEIEIGRTLTVAASGLPEVWNAKSMAVVWPATDAERDAAAVLFDPTVAQTSGFASGDYESLSAAIAAFGIKQGAGGNATLRKGKWYFDGLPPSLSSRFYLDTTRDLDSCLVLIGEQEDNPGGVELLHVNVLSESERETLAGLVDDTAESSADIGKWQTAIGKLAKTPVRPSKHTIVSSSEDRIDYVPRDHYALFTMGATNYITLIENDSTNEFMNVAAGDPIQMRVLKVVPKYYVGRVVTREDPLNLLSQQLSVLYAEAFAGKPEQYVFEWRSARPNPDGTVPANPSENYTLKFPLSDSEGLTRFVIGGQGDTLANMVNTYYAVRYRAASTNSPSYAAMGDAWSDWSAPPALAEGWVQRVLNNVTPFAQRMRDLEANEAETAISMVRQAGGPFEGDVALNQDNLAEVGLIQLYETLLDKAESMSLSLGIDDLDANKQLQLAVGRLADLYNLLGDEAYTDALNPTIGFGSNFNNPNMTGFELDYGALSSSLFAFDNQVPTLLDEELALLRGRSGADSTGTLRLSPYYNRLVWNFTRGITAGEVAYAVNYDIGGNNKGVIDYQQAAEMFPQGHGDAYGHYLSALSGYYRLLRNPHFTWGEPAMGEMVVADAALNVDYYDEAAFAKAAQNVAKVALAVVDRTARKAVRDSGGALGAGYLDDKAGRAFGYGEWAARGGYGALANWVVANSLLPEAPTAGRYWRYVFDGSRQSFVSRSFSAADEEPFITLSTDRLWTLELQIQPDGGASSSGEPQGGAGPSPILSVDDRISTRWLVSRADDGTLTLSTHSIEPATTVYEVTYLLYTNVTQDVEADRDFYAELAVTNGIRVVECGFFGSGAPTAFPDGFAFDSAASAPPEFGTGWVCANYDEETGDYEPFLYTSGESTFTVSAAGSTMALGNAPSGSASLLAIVSQGGGTAPVASLYAADGSLLSTVTLSALGGQTALDIRHATLGGGFAGELAEFRLWDGTARTQDDLLAKRDYVSPLSTGLAFYVRCLADTPDSTFPDEVHDESSWTVSGGDWIPAQESGMAVTFEDKGLRRIDRGSVAALSSLASMVPAIQKKLDQLDAGLTPLGLASGAIPFDLTPVGIDDGESSHYEQIRDRAKTALSNARKALDRAQFYASRTRLLQESQFSRENQLETMELEAKNTLIEYFGYPYAGDIGPGGTYPQGYDGPDIYNYMWMDPTDYGVSSIDDTTVTTIVFYQGAKTYDGKWAQDLIGFTNVDETKVRTNDVSATGIVIKPDNVTGRRRANGKIQDALGEFIRAYSSFTRGIIDYDYATEQFIYEINAVRSKAVRDAIMQVAKEVNFGLDMADAISESVLKQAVNTLDVTKELMWQVAENFVSASPKIIGAGMTVNTDPSAIVAAATLPSMQAAMTSQQAILLANKNALVNIDTFDKIRQIVNEALELGNDLVDNLDDYYCRMRDAADSQYDAAVSLDGKWKALQVAMKNVETVAAEAERVIDERTLARTQAADVLTKARYNEMFFRIARNAALARYDAMFDLAQKYVWLAAQAYDYETGLLSSDPQSGERFLAEIVGARTLGEFDDDGEPAVTSGDGDGGLADILARMDQNWLVLKPRLGINNPQRYATWFSLRRELFRIHSDGRGDKAWRTALEKCWVDDLNAVPEFGHYCQPLAGSTAAAEPGLVIPFPTEIVFGKNLFGDDLVGGDAALDATWFSTRIAGAGIHFEGYNESANGYSGALPLSRTPTAYLVPIGEDRMRAPGDADKIISWRVVDQTIPAPYAIGSTELDDPDWTPLYTGATGGNDLGARIRKHPSFRAYPGATGETPSDDELDATRLVGRSAWNTKWLLIIPAGGLGADRDAALSAFVRGWDANRDGSLDVLPVRDILLGLRTYSRSGN